MFLFYRENFQDYQIFILVSRMTGPGSLPEWSMSEDLIISPAGCKIPNSRANSDSGRE